MATQPSADGVGATSKVVVNSGQLRENLVSSDLATPSSVKAFLNDK